MKGTTSWVQIRQRGRQKQTFARGDEAASGLTFRKQELSEEEFLNHPRLRDFIERLLHTQKTLRYLATRATVLTETYTSRRWETRSS